jgi:hypothetical protein
LEISLAPNYPVELLCNGRIADQNFSPEELLYFRCTDFDIQGKVNVDEIRCPDTSVNRGSLSRPEYVLYARLPKYSEYKVAQFRVDEIPSHVLKDDGQRVDFQIAHDPTQKTGSQDDNYAHCEIRAFEGGLRRKNVASTAAKKYRMKLRNAMVPVANLPVLPEQLQEENGPAG